MAAEHGWSGARKRQEVERARAFLATFVGARAPVVVAAAAAKC